MRTGGPGRRAWLRPVRDGVDAPGKYALIVPPGWTLGATCGTATRSRTDSSDSAVKRGCRTVDEGTLLPNSLSRTRVRDDRLWRLLSADLAPCLAFIIQIAYS